MAPDHKYYEVLGALAATGQLSDTELAELEQHAQHCAPCNASIGEMADMSRRIFLAHASKGEKVQPPIGMQKRFVQRAIRTGVPLKPSASTLSHNNSLLLVSVVLVAMVFLSVSWKLHSANVPQTAATAADTPALRSYSPTQQEAFPPKKTTQGLVHRPARQQNRAALTRSQDRIFQPPSLEQKAPSFTFYPSKFASGSLVATNYVTSGLYPPANKFVLPDLRYSPKLASLAFLASPQGPESETPFSGANIHTLVFHLDPGKAW
jgi:hypothetical protein